MLSWITKKVKNNDVLRMMVRTIKYCTESSHIVLYCRDYTANRYVRSFLKFILTPICIWKYFIIKGYSGRTGLAFVLTAKNESAYIEEWINFHLKQGVSHFIIYDNESTDNFYDILIPYIEAGIVTYYRLKGKFRQTDAYNMALVNYGRKFKYMGFIDCDEFVFVRKLPRGMGEGGTLYDFMEQFMSYHKNAGGIGINWCMFGSSGHHKKPKGGVLENFTMRAEKDFGTNRLIKTICDPMKVLSIPSVHFPIYRRGFHNLDEEGNIIAHGYSLTKEVRFDKIRINHYYTKSKEEYMINKIKRGYADSTVRNIDDFYFCDRNEVIDTEILSRL